MKFFQKLTLPLVLAAALALGSVASASAQTVERSTRTAAGQASYPAGTLCPFQVDASYSFIIHQTFFYDDAGILIKKYYTVDETDTWTANAKTLVGHEIFREQFIYNDGELQQFVATGLATSGGKILLGPDGGVFIGSGLGRLVLDGDFQVVSFSGMPSVAMPADPSAFCAALA